MHDGKFGLNYTKKLEFAVFLPLLCLFQVSLRQAKNRYTANASFDPVSLTKGYRDAHRKTADRLLNRISLT